jgi:cytoskeletal protein CcmA (bactofilin family)
MFGHKEEFKTASIIGEETEFKGTLKDKGNIRIDGKFEGEIQVEGNVIVGKDAFIKANIRAKSINISGKVVGNIDCQEKVELFSSGSLEGKVKASDLTIAEGAFFNGECRMIPLQESVEEKSSENDAEQ